MFGGDPFGDPFTHMRRQMRDMDRMMGAMMDPFGTMDPFFGGRHHNPQNMIENGQNRTGRPVSRRGPMQDDMDMMAFNNGYFGGGLLGGIGNLMNQMEGISHRAMNDPGAHVFTQSTMISFDGNNGPRVVQESVRKTGDVRETRRSVQNGMEEAEMEVGHHVGDRAHIIEKKRDKDGRVRQQQRFVNLDEEEADSFNQEFKTRAQRNLGNLFETREVDSDRAIENGSRNDRSHGAKSRSSKSYKDQTSGSGGSHAPIVTIPDDEEEHEDSRRHRNRHRENYYYPNSTGITIREISDEEADMSIPKRRKGGR